MTPKLIIKHNRATKTRKIAKYMSNYNQSNTKKGEKRARRVGEVPWSQTGHYKETSKRQILRADHDTTFQVSRRASEESLVATEKAQLEFYGYYSSKDASQKNA